LLKTWSLAVRVYVHGLFLEIDFRMRNGLLDGMETPLALR